MALNIKDPETDRLVRQLAEVTGESITDAVRAAAEERLARVRPERSLEDVLAAVDRIVERFNSHPVLDDRTPEEILGYDEHGLPS